MTILCKHCHQKIRRNAVNKWIHYNSTNGEVWPYCDGIRAEPEEEQP
jgi:hypothetical protein